MQLQCEVGLDNSAMRPAGVYLPTFERDRSLAIDATINRLFRKKLIRGNVLTGLGLRQDKLRKAQSRTLCLTPGHQLLIFNAETLGGV